MKISNLRLKLITLFNPNYTLVADDYYDYSCIRGCSLITFKNNKVYCKSDNGEDVYTVSVYAKLVSANDEKYVKYRTEHYDSANDVYQLKQSNQNKILRRGTK